MNKPLYSLPYTILSILVLMTIQACSDRVILVEEANSDYEIVWIGDTANHAHQPAMVLQNYLKQISGAVLPIQWASQKGSQKRKIFIGKDVIPSSSAHEISYKTDGESLLISGGSNKAVENAVYQFLESHLGCRWYSPSIEKVPEMNRIEIPASLNYTYTPDILTRTVHANLFYQNHDFADKHKVTYEPFPGYVPDARVHTFHRFMPETAFFEQHPEYYALRGNTRLPTQLCLTNKQVLNIVNDSVAAYFNRFPDANIISVSQDDNQQYCECIQCAELDRTEGSHAGSLIHFVNAVAAAFPEKTISTLAYQHTRKAPKTRPAPNVLVTLCSIECDRSAPIAVKCKDFASDLSGWKKITNNIRIWDYTTQFTNFLAPFPNIHTLAPNVRYFRDHGAKWIFEQHSGNPSELFELRAYLTAKLLWNPELITQDVITEFTDGYYEEGGVFIRKYINRIHEELRRYPDFFLFLYGDPSQAFGSYLRADLLGEFDAYFDSAELVIDGKNKTLDHIRTARLGIEYTILEASRKNISADYSLTSHGADGKIQINQKTKSRLERLEQTCAKAEVIFMNEMGFTVSDYVLNYEKAMQTASIPNKAQGKKVSLLTKPKKYASEDPQTLTDGALGGNGFYANWLGFEGNDLQAVVDLGEEQMLSQARLAFLQVTNHIVFFPKEVVYYASRDGKRYDRLGQVLNDEPLTKTSKINDIKYFNLTWKPQPIRYLKIEAKNLSKAPYWHHAAGLPVWIFADEIILE